MTVSDWGGFRCCVIIVCIVLNLCFICSSCWLTEPKTLHRQSDLNKNGSFIFGPRSKNICTLQKYKPVLSIQLVPKYKLHSNIQVTSLELGQTQSHNSYILASVITYWYFFASAFILLKNGFMRWMELMELDWWSPHPGCISPWDLQATKRVKLFHIKTLTNEPSARFSVNKTLYTKIKNHETILHLLHNDDKLLQHHVGRVHCGDSYLAKNTQKRLHLSVLLCAFLCFSLLSNPH